MDERTPTPTPRGPSGPSGGSTNKGPSGWPEWVDTWVLPYLEDSTLWPVAIALLGHVWLVLAVAILAFVRTWNPIAGLLMFLLISGSVELLRGEWAAIGRLRTVTFVVIVSWAIAAVMAWQLGSIGVL